MDDPIEALGYVKMHRDQQEVAVCDKEIYLVDQRPCVLWSIQFFLLLKSHFVKDYFHHHLKLFSYFLSFVREY